MRGRQYSDRPLSSLTNSYALKYPIFYSESDLVCIITLMMKKIMFLTIILVLGKAVAAEYPTLNTRIKYFSNETQNFRFYEQAEKRDSKLILFDVEIVPLENSIYKKVQPLLDRVTGAYRRHFPNRIGNLPKPLLAIVDTDDLNAHVQMSHQWGQETRYTKPWIIFVNRGLAEKLSEEGLTSTIAHEFAHLFQINNPQWSVHGYSLYLADPNSEPVAFVKAQNENLEVRKILEEYLYLFNDIGGNDDLNVQGIPFLPSQPYSFDKKFALVPGYSSQPDKHFLGPMLINGTDITSLQKNDNSCFEALEKYMLITNAAYLQFGATNKIVDFTILGSQFIKALKACKGIDTKPTWQLALSTGPVSYPSLLDLLTPLLKQEFDAKMTSYESFNGNLVDWIISTTKKQYARMNELRKKIPANKIRLFTLEDDADYYAAVISVVLGANPSKGLREMHTHAKKSSPFTCGFDRQDGLINYGNLLEPHHSLCWRIEQAELTSQYLRTNHN